MTRSGCVLDIRIWSFKACATCVVMKVWCSVIRKLRLYVHANGKMSEKEQERTRCLRENHVFNEPAIALR
jgi:hypothetical protein